MIWQDIVPIIGNTIFIAALIPSILSRHKPHRWSCGLTACVLLLYAVTFWSQTMWYWSAATLATASAWIILLMQRRA